MQGSSTDEGAYTPPMEVEIYSNSEGCGIKVLRDFCNELMGENADQVREQKLRAALRLCLARLEEYPDARNGTAIQIAKTELQ